MTILRIGSTKKYAAGWDTAFAKKKTSTKKATARKAAAKKASRKKR